MANPRWTRDETIIALQFYFDHAPSIPPKNSHQIYELSQVLNNLQTKLGGAIPEKFRNPNGVYMKLMNFCHLDPTHKGKGLDHGNKLDLEVWDIYSDNREELQRVSDAIKSFVTFGQIVLPLEDITNEDGEGQEGKILTGIHRYRERDKSLANRKKRQAITTHGFLACEACEFDFGTFYGEVGQGYMECHHTKPLSEMPVEGETTKLSDLALLCSDCHRMIHRIRPWPTIEEFRNVIGAIH